jgi:2-methylisocitrate lyase-like PEP mutase family enzyme
VGSEDGEQLSPDAAFAHVATITAATELPATADMESGYQLEPAEFVERLVRAGAVGCNFEDTSHHSVEPLVDAQTQAEQIAALKAAGRDIGVDIVVNARADIFARRVGDFDEQVSEGLRRARMYREAGADCIYPILLTDREVIASFVETVGVVNIMSLPDAPSLPELRALGVRRVSVGSQLHRVALDAFRASASELRDDT